MEPTKLDQLFAAKAILKRAEARVKELEYECKEELLESYHEEGTDRKRSPYFGNDAGCLYIKQGKQGEHKVREFIADYQAVTNWMDDQRPDTDCFAQDNLELFCSWWFKQTGEIIPGFERIEYMTEGTAPTPVLTVKDDVVIPKLTESGLLEGSARFLLGDGE